MTMYTDAAFTYLSGPGNTHFEIYVMDTNGDNLRLLTAPPHSDHSPSWSPEGRQIVFHSTRNKNTDIYIMDANGQNVRQLTNHPDVDIYPVWSPDGTQIAFTSYVKPNRRGDIYVIDVNGQNRRNLTNHPANDRRPAWSPDGTQIVFESDRDGQRGVNHGIYVMAADGKDVHQLTNGFTPAWFDPVFTRSVSPKRKSTTMWGRIKQSTKWNWLYCTLSHSCKGQCSEVESESCYRWRGYNPLSTGHCPIFWEDTKGSLRL